MFFKTDIENFEEFEEDSVGHLRKKLHSMKGTKAPKVKISLAILRMIPFANKFISSLELAGCSMNHLVELKGFVNHASSAAAEGFQIIKLLTSLADFVVIPIIYLGAFITNQDIPFTLSRNARFLYASVILGLTITALAFPPSAPFIALATSVAALGLNLVTLAKIVYKRYELKDNLINFEKNINAKKTRLNVLIDELEQLEKKAKRAKENENQEEYLSLESQIANARKKINEEMSGLQELYNDQELCKEKLESLSTAAILDKSVGTAFATLALIGVIVSFIAPPVGIGILAAAASLAVAYTVGRLSYPLFKMLANKITNPSPKPQPGKEEREEDGDQDALIETEIETSAKKVKKDMSEIKKVANQLLETVEDYPVIPQANKTEQITPHLVPEVTVIKAQPNVGEVKEEEDEGESPKF
ncbi:hypothetical protein [Fluoribacter dumoffii]|uniref:Coiled-coil protein n=1 Tax=Fluoribacter dumoffii TaxID=463 RepID=A0A377G5G6_9GAMM|nr:hypothetical protein [Fluoribacter dumoffii]KTC91589.1 coiled-coil protein [Fluoribacter dumoffii NY 23]STO20055.1 Uncharacterised protein [Fluoribacter dumoffii]